MRRSRKGLGRVRGVRLTLFDEPTSHRARSAPAFGAMARLAAAHKPTC
jgi:hypothetical protein